MHCRRNTEEPGPKFTEIFVPGASKALSEQFVSFTTTRALSYPGNVFSPGCETTHNNAPRTMKIICKNNKKYGRGKPTPVMVSTVVRFG